MQFFAAICSEFLVHQLYTITLMWYNIKIKVLLWTVIVAMCLCAFVFGGAGAPVRELDGEERPFEIFASVQELQRYRLSHEGDFFNLSEQEYGSYDDAFFQNNALVMFLSRGMSGSIRCIAESARLENSALVVRVKELSPPMHTMDLHYNTLAVAVPRAMARDITSVLVDAHRVEL